MDIPANVLLATTLETDRDDLVKAISLAPVPSKRYKDFLAVKHPRKMITIEPVMKFNHDKMLEWIVNIKPERIFLGYDSRKTNLQEPTLDEFYALKNDIESLGFSIDLKTIRRGL